jgi:hypothetical protein
MRQSTVGSKSAGAAGGGTGGSGGGVLGGVSDVLTIEQCSVHPAVHATAAPARARYNTGVSTSSSPSPDSSSTPLGCGCLVRTGRDFLGRVIGTVVAHGASCPREDHQPGHVVLMPGREHARPE